MRAVVRLAALAMMSLAIACPAVAQDSPPAKGKAKDPNQIVCQKQEVLGSRLAVKRVCMTRAEWAERRRDDRDLVQRSQLGPCVRKAGC
jgi:hypothetical protein